ncbi:sialidase-3-like [Pseudophryne corroboree]|uniref:sialidase-3-like n=1 Tax=Pseudophryne corroboree TaxID=495146 RepID=UPI0030817393
MTAAQPQTLFKKEPGGPVYRIPSLIYMRAENMFLAFAEKRKDGSDTSAECLVMRRGVYKADNVAWEDVQSVHDVCMKNHRPMNPCPVYEDTTKVLFLFFNCIPDGMSEEYMKMWGNSAKMCYVISRDWGTTWSNTFDITHVTSHIGNMATVFLSPGHGIQTKSGKLIIPAYVYVAKYWFINWWFPKAHSFYVYSEDQGNTWWISERINKFECGECELAEILSKGNKSMLYLNARTTSSMRMEAQMLNVGSEFSVVEESSKLKEINDGCFGSVISFPGTVRPGQEHTDWLLFSHPTKVGRKDLGIFLNKSPLMSEVWSKPWIIHDGPAAYSDLAVCWDNKIFAILFETGVVSPYEKISFRLFTLHDVLKNI